MKKEFVDIVKDADLVLVGIGSEFEVKRFQKEEVAVKALQELKHILKQKNYFVITTCTNGILDEVEFDKEKIVSPCGTMKLKQCPNHCENSLQIVTNEEKELLNTLQGDIEKIYLGECNHCKEKLVLNNVYAKQYDEDGYLESWQNYTRWLQQTLNKKLCILELGVDFNFPSIIRWPFEKVAYYNQKASFIRVHQKLYQMSEELKDKGIAIEMNAIDWLLEKQI